MIRKSKRPVRYPSGRTWRPIFRAAAQLDREYLLAADTETAPSIPWFAAIQGIKSKKDLAGLAPKGCFISAEAVERVVGQIGETQKATRELSGRIDIRFDRFRHGARHGFCSIRDTVRCRIAVETGRERLPEQRIDDLSGSRVKLAGLPELTQMVSLNFEQVGFHSCRAAQSPPQMANRSTSSRSTAD